ncbi:MAG: hypothetical protein AAGF73_11900 [Actinomycetota bacterium]
MHTSKEPAFTDATVSELRHSPWRAAMIVSGFIAAALPPLSGINDRSSNRCMNHCAFTVSASSHMVGLLKS